MGKRGNSLTKSVNGYVEAYDSYRGKRERDYVNCMDKDMCVVWVFWC